LTERNSGEDNIKAVVEKNHAKSKSVLSKHLSSRVDKNSIDFDDIQPIKQGDYVNIGSKNSR
jgi:hypothetical protein